MKPKHFLIADTETTGLPPRNFVYDFGYLIATRNGIIIERQFLIREVLTAPQFMLSALNNNDWRSAFGGKIFDHYIPRIDSDDYRLTGWRDVIEQLRDDILTFSVKVFSAYNLGFDMGAIKKTNERLVMQPGKILPCKVDLLDLWQFSCQTALNTRLYHEFAHRYGLVSDAGNVRTTAEATYRFLTANPNFIESHTALDDAQIETEILQRLLARKKTIPYNEVQHMPWRIAQEISD